MFTTIWSLIFGLVIQSVSLDRQPLPSAPLPEKPIEEVQAPASTATTDSATQLAKCLTTKGIKMYGAFWCPHCADQKKAFGEAFQYVRYVECDPKGPGADPKACEHAGIEAYPTWISASGEKQVGIKSLSDLATWSKCPN